MESSININKARLAPEKQDSHLPAYFFKMRITREVIYMRKKCTKCGEVKSLDLFGNSSRSKDGRRSSCKACRKLDYIKNIDKIKEKAKVYRSFNKKNISIQNKRYREKNKDKIKDSLSRYYKENKESILINAKKRYEKNKEEIKIYQKKYRRDNDKKLSLYKKDWAEKNREFMKEWKARYYIDNLESIKRYKAENEEKIKANARKYRSDNKESIKFKAEANRKKQSLLRISELKDIIHPNIDNKWIYVMRSGEFYKIGISKDPLRRLSEIKKATFDDTSLIALSKAKYGRTVDCESMIHNDLIDFNVPMIYKNGTHSREWFFCDIDLIKENIMQYSDFIDLKKQGLYNV